MVTSRARKAFERLVDRRGADITWHKESLGQLCPCRTRQGFRDPEKHKALAHLLASYNNTTPGSNLPVPDGTQFNYLFIPYLISEEPGIDGYIGRGELLTTSSVAGNTFQFVVQVPPALRKTLSHIDVWRSGGDLLHFERIISLTPQQPDPTVIFWTDQQPYRQLTLVKLSQADVPECNDDAIIPVIFERKVKGFVQPAFISTRSRSNQILIEQFGEMQADDHIGVFPLQYENYQLDFTDWSDAGSDWIEFNGLRFIAVAWNLLPAPDDASVNHHWEVALRRINNDRTIEKIVP